MDFIAVDAHAHCGVLDRFPPQSLEDYLSSLRGRRIDGAVMFSPVIEIYDRHDRDFKDNPEWRGRRRSSNEYLLSASRPGFEVFPYFFIWNDFAVEQLTTRHKGIKWHRHDDEPVYHYDDPGCLAAIDEIRRRNMPVCLEEELDNTVFFVDRLAPGVRVVIPHLGLLNGGYPAIRRAGLWERPEIYADTSLASSREIMDYVERYGHERLMFGSDFPFGAPKRELEKVLRLPLPDEVKHDLVERNVRKMMAESNSG